MLGATFRLGREGRVRLLLPIIKLNTIELLDLRLGPVGAVGASYLPMMADGTGHADISRGYRHTIRQTAAFGHKVCRRLA